MPASAQSVGVSLITASANHDLLGERLSGGAIRIGYALPRTPLSLRLSAEKLSGDASRFGVPCAGLIPPAGCDPEPLRDDASLTIATGGVGLHMLSWRRLLVEATGDFGAGRIRVDTRGLTSGKMLRATKTVWSNAVGLEASWLPWASVPIALEAGASAGRLSPTSQELTPDGYTPFETSFSISRLHIGAAWRRVRR
jgi:hypothetical protein